MKPEEIARLIREEAKRIEADQPGQPQNINGPVPSEGSKPEKQNVTAATEIPLPSQSPQFSVPKNFSTNFLPEDNGTPTKVEPLLNASLCTQYESCLDVPFSLIPLWWEEKTKKYTDLPLVRALCMYDRFFLLVQMFGRQDMLHEWLYDRCREVEREPDNCLDLWSRFHYKAVDLREAVPTPSGWKRHGDLEPGDFVFGPDGNPKKVLARTEVFTDADCWVVKFDKGYEVVVSAEHLWTVDVASKARVGDGREGRKTVTINTRELAAEVAHSQAVESRILPSVPVAKALEYPVSTLPIPPYVLGVWLGDGNNADGRITKDVRDDFILEKIDPLCRATRQSGRSVQILGLTYKLRKIGLLNNKHIPSNYLTACIEDRWNLLQGLMDTDGHCDMRGTATFVNTNPTLAGNVFELAVSLGLKPSLRHVDGTHNDQPYPYYQVSLQSRHDKQVFSLPRKQDRSTDGKITRSGRHAIVSVEPADTVPVSCIQVEGGEYLIGEHCIPTHNSTIITYAGVIQEILKDPELTVGIFSHVKPIAKGFLSQIKRELEANEQLKKLFPDVLFENPERQSPSWSIDNGLIVKRKGNPKEPTISAYGLVDGQPVSMHFRLRVYDDVVTQASVSTPEQVSKTTEAFEQSANLGTEDGRRWMVGTRWSYADTYAEIMKKKMVKVRLYPATSDGTFTGVPVLWSPEFNEQMKMEQGEATYATQCLQNPLAGSQKMFDVSDLQVYEVRPETLAVYILIDPARSKKTDSDNTAMVVVGLDYAANKYILDGFNHKMDLQERWQNTARLYERWKRATGVQALYVGYESFAAQADLDYFKEQQNLTKLHFNIVELAWPREGGGSKLDRVQRLGPDMRSHKIFLPYATDDKNLTAAQRRVSQGYDYRISRKIKRKDQNNETYDLTEQLKEQIFYFPFGGKKDLVDALSRIYDMEPRAPSYREQRYSEPEFV